MILLSAEDAIRRNDITNMSREILKAYVDDKNRGLYKSSYVPESSNQDEYEIYGI